MQEEEICLGAIRVASGKLLVSDPCYLPDDPAKPNEHSLYGGTIIEDVPEGTFPVRASISDEGPWGKRVAELRIEFAGSGVGNDKREVARVGVDSGQMSFTDYANVEQWGGDLRGSYHVDSFGKECYAKYERGEFNYMAACGATLGPTGEGTDTFGGVIGGNKMAASSTGFGDGQYVVYAEHRDGKLLSVTVDFGLNDEDDDYEEEDDIEDEDEDEDE